MSESWKEEVLHCWYAHSSGHKTVERKRQDEEIRESHEEAADIREEPSTVKKQWPSRMTTGSWG